MDEPRIVGLKDSSSSMIYLHRVLGLLPHRPDWAVLVGPRRCSPMRCSPAPTAA